MKLASELNIDIPRSYTINKYEDLDTSIINLHYPVVIKPARSRVSINNTWEFTSVTYANDKDDLDHQLSKYNNNIYPILIQERIVGPGLGIFMCYENGKPIASFSHKRLREKPPSGGVSVLRESIPLDPIAYQFSEQLLTSLQWQGVAMVEFKVDKRDGRPKLMEINGRFWGSLQLAIDSGVNFPLLLANIIESKSVQPVSDYKIGIKSRWLWGDIDTLLLRLFKSQQLHPEVESKTKYLFNFLKFWQPKLHYDVLRLNDIKPWLFESYQWFRKLLQ